MIRRYTYGTAQVQGNVRTRLNHVHKSEEVRRVSGTRPRRVRPESQTRARRVSDAVSTRLRRVRTLPWT